MRPILRIVPKMAKRRSVCFPEPEQLVAYARKAGLTIPKLWTIIEAELARHPLPHQIVIRGPKQVVTIKLRRDSDILKKQVFDGAELGTRRPHLSEREEDVQGDEDAGASIPGIENIVDDKNISDMNPAAKKGHNRTPWPLGKKKVKPPRYPIPEERPNIFDGLLSEAFRERQRLFREQWADANRTHNWPSWLVCDYNNQFVGQMLQLLYPNLFTSEKEKHDAAITLEAVNVFLRGHKPGEDSPLYKMKDKSVARRVQRFLKQVEKWLEREAIFAGVEAEVDRAEASAYLEESYEQARAEGDVERIRELQDDFGRFADDEDDDVIRLWRKRLDDEE